MKMSAVKNYVLCYYCMLSFVSLTSYLFYIYISVVIRRFTTSEDVCWNIRNIKLKSFFSEMRRYFLKFITAVCFLFLLKLRWPKNKSIYHLYSQKADLNFCCYSTVYYFRRCTLEHTKHQVKVFFFQKWVYISSLFITAVCFLFLLKLSDQKTKVSSICVLKADCKYSRETQHHINATTLSCDKQNITLWH